MISDAKRKKRGEDKFRELTGRGPDALRASMAGLAPDAAEYVVEVVYGEMYQRAGLDIKTRQIGRRCLPGGGVPVLWSAVTPAPAIRPAPAAV